MSNTQVFSGNSETIFLSLYGYVWALSCQLPGLTVVAVGKVRRDGESLSIQMKLE